MPAVFGKQAKRVHIALLQKLRHPRALLGREAGIALIVFWPRDVDLRVRDVEITSQNNGLGLDQLIAVFFKLLVKRELKRQPSQANRRVGKIRVDEVVRPQVQSRDPAFLVIVFLAHALGDRQ